MFLDKSTKICLRLSTKFIKKKTTRDKLTLLNTRIMERLLPISKSTNKKPISKLKPRLQNALRLLFLKA